MRTALPARRAKTIRGSRGFAARLALAFGCLLLSACAKRQQNSTLPGASFALPSSESSKGPALNLTLTTAQRQVLDVAQLRGRPLLLLLFATFDGASQVSLRALREFLQEHPEVQAVGVAVQPNARLLIDAWRAALDPPFTVTYDAEHQIEEGRSSLGKLEAIPTWVMLDAGGHEVGRHIGIVNRRILNRLHARLLNVR